MRTSKFGLSFKGLALIAILSGSHVSFAAEVPQGKPSKITVAKGLSGLKPDQNRPMSPFWTAPLAKPEKDKGLPANDKTVEMGGFSDGGGNAVGGTLFDFYENESSVAISLEQLISMSPEVQQIIPYLNKQVPAVHTMDGKALGTLLLTSLKPKKIYLETKDISSQQCQNQSLVASAERIIAACQSDTELRISLQWYKAADGRNRAGLVLHELILAWLRTELRGKVEKEVFEQKVRELNRVIFSAQKGELATAVTEITGIKVYNAREFALLKNLPAKIPGVTAAFCKNPALGPAGTLPEYFSDEFLVSELPANLTEMQAVADTIRSGARYDVDALNDKVQDVCHDWFLDALPNRRPDMQKISKSCAMNMDALVKEIANQGTSEQRFTIKSSINSIKFNSIICSGNKKEQLEESVIYAKWNLKKYGITINFTKGTAE